MIASAGAGSGSPTGILKTVASSTTQPYLQAGRNNLLSDLQKRLWNMEMQILMISSRHDDDIDSDDVLEAAVVRCGIILIPQVVHGVIMRSVRGNSSAGRHEVRPLLGRVGGDILCDVPM